MMNEYSISVIIPTQNEADRIGQCLEAIFAQYQTPDQIIIVDGYSIDETVDRAKRFPVKICYEEYHTRAGACQVGIENAEGDYIAFTDADCIPEKDWLENLVKEFSEGVVGVGGGIKNIGEGLWIQSINFAYGTFLGSANSVQGRLFKGKRFVNSISGCNSMYLRGDIWSVGGFNVSLSGAEDTELNKRLLKRGKLIYTPNAIVLHNHRWTLKGFAKKMYRYGKERGIVRKWDLQVIPALVAPLLLLSLIFTPWLLAIMACLYVAILASTGLKFAVQERNAKYFLSIPVVYLTEHGSYSVGLWRGWGQSMIERSKGN